MPVPELVHQRGYALCDRGLPGETGIGSRAVQSQYPSGSLVKFVLTGEVEVDAEINCEYLQNLFSDYFYFEKVKDRTTLRVDYSDYEKDASLKGEFIRMVLGSELSQEQKAEVIRCGILALSGEEI